MRAFRFLNLVILSMLVGCSALVVAQDDKQQDVKPPQQEEPKGEPKAQPKQDEMKPPKQEDAKPTKTEKQDEKQEQKQEQKNSRDQMKPEQQMHPAQAGHPQPAGKTARIPDDKFREHFGRGHSFNAKTVIVQGRPQFQYGGYSFELVDAWPADWAYTDDCYIDYIDGEYFLFDVLHPGVRIAVVVAM